MPQLNALTNASQRKLVAAIAIVGPALLYAGSAQATNHAEIETDPLLVELAQEGRVLSPLGVWTGR